MAKKQNIVCRSEVFYHLHTKLSPPSTSLARPGQGELSNGQSQVINAISTLAMKCVVSGTNRLFPEDDKRPLSVFNVNM